METLHKKTFNDCGHAVLSFVTKDKECNEANAESPKWSSYQKKLPELIYYDVEGGKQKILIKSMMHASKLFKMGSYVYDIPNWNPISLTLEK